MQLLRYHKKGFKTINASANSIKLRQLSNRSFNLHLATRNLFGNEKYFHISHFMLIIKEGNYLETDHQHEFSEVCLSSGSVGPCVVDAVFTLIGAV